MSANDNVKVIQSVYEAFGRGDVAAILEVLTDDVDWATEVADSAGAPWWGVRHGRDAVARFFEAFGSTMEVEEFAPLSFAANDTDVLTVVRMRAKARANGRSIAMNLHHHFTFRGGKIAYYRGTEDTQQTAAALREEDGRGGPGGCTSALWCNSRMLPSRTAAGVARARARLTRPATTDGDPDAEQRLNADLGGGDLPDAPAPMFHHIAARTRFFDAVTLAAVESGTTQVVIVGAGYDGRALRFRLPGVRYFELDLPATQIDKRERLARLGIPVDDVTFVPIDLAEADVDGALGAAGHDATRTSLFICEGLLVYLDLPGRWA